MADDIRIARWDLVATAGTTQRLIFTAPVAIGALAVYVGGTVVDVDDLTGATAYIATVDGSEATVDVVVPTGSSVALRLVVDGGVVTVGRLTPSTSGTTSADNTITLVAGGVAAYTIEVAGAAGPQGEVGPPGPAGSDADATAAIEAHRVDTTDVHGIADTALLETTAGAQSKADAAQAAAEAAAAAADTALDGRLDTVETTLPLKADLVGGVVPTAQMPAISIMERVPVADEAARLLLANPGDVQIGDVAVQADTGTTWLLVADDPSLAGSWKAIDQADAVSSVNGQTGTVVLGKADVGLGSVDNTADLSKPISTATQTALDAKAPVASPALTGTPTAPTAAAGDNTTQIATTAHVKTAVDNATSGADVHARNTAYYYAAPAYGVSTTGAIASGALYAVRLMLPVATTLIRLGVEITTAASAGTLRFGLYNDSGGLPNTLLMDGGPVGATSTGAKEVVISQAVGPGPVWLALLAEGTTGSPAMRRVNGQNPSGGSSLLANILANDAGGFVRTGVAAGALPTPFGASPTLLVNPPKFAIRYA